MNFRTGDLLTANYYSSVFFWIHRSALCGKHPCQRSLNSKRKELNIENGYLDNSMTNVRRCDSFEIEKLKKDFGLNEKLEIINVNEWRQLDNLNWYGLK